jgi:hypothetical protein
MPVLFRLLLLSSISCVYGGVVFSGNAVNGQLQSTYVNNWILKHRLL